VLRGVRVLVKTNERGLGFSAASNRRFKRTPRFSRLPKRTKLDFSLQVAKGLISLLERTRTGLREMPSNAVWLLSRALSPVDAIEEAAESERLWSTRLRWAVTL
jgi:hypothetical protein